MTVEYLLLKIKSLSVKTVARAKTYAEVWDVCLRHNHRFDMAEEGYGTIDTSRSHLNRVLRGSNDLRDLLIDVRDRIGGATLRSNVKIGVEVVFSLRAGSPVVQVAYFNDCLAWTESYFGVPCISAVVHNDQPNVHAHLLLLPLKNGKFCGDKLVGGGPAFIKLTNAHFFEHVGRKYGLTLPRPQKPLGAAVRRQAMATARRALEATSGLSAPLLDAIFNPRGVDVEALLSTLGLPMPEPKLAGSFIGTMTKKTKREKNPYTDSADLSSGQKKPKSTNHDPVYGLTDSARSVH